jgi:hypothetical protein
VIEGNGDKEIKGGGRASSIASDSSRKHKWGEDGDGDALRQRDYCEE